MPHTDPVERAAYQRAYREKNRKKLQAQTLAWKRRNKARVGSINSASHYKRCSEDVPTYLKYILKYSRRRRPENHSLTHDDMVRMWSEQNGRCALTGVQMTHLVKSNNGKAVHTNVSLDRLDCAKGYSPDNVRLVCWIVNVMRRDLTTDEFIEWAELVVGHKNENHHASHPPSAEA